MCRKAGFRRRTDYLIWNSAQIATTTTAKWSETSVNRGRKSEILRPLLDRKICKVSKLKAAVYLAELGLYILQVPLHGA